MRLSNHHKRLLRDGALFLPRWEYAQDDEYRAIDSIESYWSENWVEASAIGYQHDDWLQLALQIQI